MQKHYLVKYDLKIETGVFLKKELVEAGVGGCDALVVASIIRGNDTGEPHEGPKSIAVFSWDGRDPTREQEIPPSELFQVMLHLCHMIANDGEAPNWQRELCETTFEAARSIITGKRNSL